MFFTFSQNNSGGRWDIDDDRGIAEVVVIESDDEKEAIYLAERIGPSISMVMGIVHVVEIDGPIMMSLDMTYQRYMEKN